MKALGDESGNKPDQWPSKVEAISDRWDYFFSRSASDMESALFE